MENVSFFLRKMLPSYCEITKHGDVYNKKKKKMVVGTLMMIAKSSKTSPVLRDVHETSTIFFS